MTLEEINEVLDLHFKWLNHEPKGARADLNGANLRGANLCGANLCGADLRGANLYRADLYRADLRDANLCDALLNTANLCGANLRGADLCGADLRGADLRGANLCNALLNTANLCGANLRGADLCGADLNEANLCDVEHNARTLFFALQCPEEGAFIGWKKTNGGYIVKLEIPADARRLSATSRKCRADKALVLGIYNVNRELLNKQETRSLFDVNFIYRVGEIVTVDNFEENRWIECAAGIHFFLTFDEAKNY